MSKMSKMNKFSVNNPDGFFNLVSLMCRVGVVWSELYPDADKKTWSIVHDLSDAIIPIFIKHYSHFLDSFVCIFVEDLRKIYSEVRDKKISLEEGQNLIRALVIKTILYDEERDYEADVRSGVKFLSKGFDRSLYPSGPKDAAIELGLGHFGRSKTTYYNIARKNILKNYPEFSVDNQTIISWIQDSLNFSGKRQKSDNESKFTLSALFRKNNISRDLLNSYNIFATLINSHLANIPEIDEKYFKPNSIRKKEKGISREKRPLKRI